MASSVNIVDMWQILYLRLKIYRPSERGGGFVVSRCVSEEPGRKSEANGLCAVRPLEWTQPTGVESLQTREIMQAAALSMCPMRQTVAVKESLDIPQR